MKQSLYRWFLAIGVLTLVLAACTPPASKGFIRVTASGIPAGQTATLGIAKADNTQADSLTLGNESKTSKELDPATYALSAGDIVAGGFTFKPSLNPASANVEAGKTTEVALSYAASDGRLSITIGGLPSGASGQVTVARQGGGFSQVITAATTLSGLVPGTYSITPADVSSAGTTYTAASSTVAVTAGSTANVAVNYAAGTGSLQVNISGLPTGVSGVVNVSGPNGYTNNLTDSQTITNLSPGSYTVIANNVVLGGITYVATVSASPANVIAGQTTNVGVAYAASTGRLTITTTGLPTGANPNIAVTGPGSFNQTVSTVSITLDNLAPGSYTLVANNVVANATYSGTVSPSPVSVVAGSTANVNVAYSASNGSLQISLSGLPASLGTTVTVSNSNPVFNQVVVFNAGETSKTIAAPVGSGYAFAVNPVTKAGTFADDYYTPAAVSPASVSAATTTTVGVTYSKRGGTGLLWVAATVPDATSGVFNYDETRLAAGSGTQTGSLPVSGLTRPLGLVFDKKGNLYISSQNGDEIWRFPASELGDPTPTPDLEISAGTNLNGPEYMALDAAGNLWVANNTGSNVVRFNKSDLDSQTGSVTLTPGMVLTSSIYDVFDGAVGLAFDDNGNLYVSAFISNKVTRVAASVLGGSGTVDIITTANIVWVQNFSGPAGIALDASGGLWVAQYAADSIIKVGNAFSTNAELVNATTTITSTAMLQPNAIAFDNQGKLWVTTNNGASASSGSGKLIKLDPATGGGQDTPAANLSVAAGATGLAFNLHPSGLLLNGRP